MIIVVHPFTHLYAAYTRLITRRAGRRFLYFGVLLREPSIRVNEEGPTFAGLPRYIVEDIARSSSEHRLNIALTWHVIALMSLWCFETRLCTCLHMMHTRQHSEHTWCVLMAEGCTTVFHGVSVLFKGCLCDVEAMLRVVEAMIW